MAVQLACPVTLRRLPAVARARCLTRPTLGYRPGVAAGFLSGCARRAIILEAFHYAEEKHA